MKEFERHQFNNGDRGDRLHPRRFDRSYWHLTLLYNKLGSVVNGDLLPPGEQVLDFGCGNQPYRSLLETKFKRYDHANNCLAETIALIAFCPRRLPRALRPLYTWFFQSLIGLIERRQPDKLSNDASCYIVLARKPNGNDAGRMGSEKLNEGD